MVIVDAITLILATLVLRLVFPPPHNILYCVSCFILGAGFGMYRGITNSKKVQK